MSRVRRDRVVVTGAGQGLGRGHTVARLAPGVRIVVDDPGRTTKAAPEDVEANGGTAPASIGIDIDGICRDRAVIVTAAGQGLGHEQPPHVRVAHSARVVINRPGETAEAVAQESEDTVGTAVADLGDISEGTGT